ncbi:palmitoyltransferase ZDHHC4 isoform X3 [Rattus norvegicus]|uniref:palmitoyltransferase ZDHHC4 isoform X3 n=1 Tax=Rattus norvegicus TaxID=10116 RepID=UPI002FD7A17E
MDFLVLFSFYLAFLLICVIMICIFTKSQRLKAVVLGGAQVCARVTPQCFQRAVQTLLHQLFHTRHPAFLALHLLLQGLVYAEYTYEVFSYCRELEFSLPCLLLPYVLLSVNLVFFTLTCSTNPASHCPVPICPPTVPHPIPPSHLQEDVPTPPPPHHCSPPPGASSLLRIRCVLSH